MTEKVKELKKFSKTIKILYVEDDKESRIQTKKMLDNFFPNTTLATNGKEGLEEYLHFYEKNSSYYDLVISDISMPIMDGLKMSKEIFAIHSLQPIIVLTAHNEIEFLANAINIGISGFITKPIEIQNFINILYKTIIAIHDRKFVLAHSHQIDNLIYENEKECEKIMQKNLQLEKSLQDIKDYNNSKNSTPSLLSIS